MEGKENKRGRIEREGQKIRRDGRKIGGMEGRMGEGNEKGRRKIEGRGKKSRRARWTGTRKEGEN